MFAVALAFTAATASASKVTTLIGDKDGFGFEAPKDQPFSFFSIGTGDTDGTDRWQFGTQSYVFDYKLPLGTVVDATLEVFTGGQGFFGPTHVLIDNAWVGNLTDGGSLFLGDNYARLDTFDLKPFLSLLKGHDTITFQTGSDDDGWVLDYVQLNVVSNAPEPATLLLTGAGLLAIGARARRRRG